MSALTVNLGANIAALWKGLASAVSAVSSAEHQMNKLGSAGIGAAMAE